MNFPNRRVRFFATMAGSESVSTRGGMVRLPHLAAFLFGQEGDERGFEVIGARPLLEFLGRTDREDLAGVHGDEPVEAVGFVHVGGGDEHAHPRPPGPDVVDERPELLPREGVDAGGGLVEDEQVGVVDQGRAEPDLLFHASRELPGRPVGERVEAGRLQERVDPCPALGAGEPEQLCEEVDVLEDAQLEVEVLSQALRHVGDERTDGVAVPAVGDVSAEHLHAAALDLLRAGDDPHEGRLADAVRADQADHTSRGDLDRDRIERARLPVPVREARDARDGFGQGQHRVTRGQAWGNVVPGRQARRPRRRGARSPCPGRRS